MKREFDDRFTIADQKREIRDLQRDLKLRSDCAKNLEAYEGQFMCSMVNCEKMAKFRYDCNFQVCEDDVKKIGQECPYCTKAIFFIYPLARSTCAVNGVVEQIKTKN